MKISNIVGARPNFVKIAPLIREMRRHPRITPIHERKKYWLMPIVLMLLMLGLSIALTSSSAFAPFIYTIF